ncbi:MAG TPA: class I SAM-dependent methyltransferase [Longimicrobium sp.]|nr:class I SAM-dependent methyltransferase [Longimicrobium sp.]
MSDILEYWNQKAERMGTDPAATMKDVILREMEIRSIGDRLRQDDTLLDVGAGNGYAAVQWSGRCRSVTALDYSPGMVQQATKAVADAGVRNVEVRQGNVLGLSELAGRYSAASAVRVLINLPTEEEQYAGVDQLVSVLAPGGRLFLVEGIQEPSDALNAARTGMGLPPNEIDWHNRLFAQAKLEAALSRECDIEERIDFGEYYFLSRVVHPLLVAPEEPSFRGRMNEVARAVWESGILRGRFADISRLILYVCRRRG